MRLRRTRAAASPFLLGLGIALVGAWNLEAWMIGGGPVSTFLGPLGLGLLAASHLMIGMRRDAR